MYTLFARPSSPIVDSRILGSSDFLAMEELVARTVRRGYEALPSRSARIAFLTDLAASQRELEGLADGRNVDYFRPRIGEAYALKYHLLRVYNVYCALAAIYDTGELPHSLNVVDMGSGTGCTTMALTLLGLRTSSPGGALRIRNVEPSPSMRRVGEQIASLLAAYTSARGRGTLRLDSRQDAASDLRQFVSGNREQIDLLVFALAFDFVESRRQRSEIARQVTKACQYLRKPAGVAVFVTPRIGTKIDLLEEIAACLEDAGLVLKQELKPSGERIERKPEPIIRLRSDLNREAERLGLDRPYLRGPSADLYYANHTSAHVFGFGGAE